MLKHIALKGRIFLSFTIKTETGLHIGGSDESISVGGVDKTVIRNPYNGRPYIPGSSLRGKIRSLTEKYKGASQNTDVGRVVIHTCDNSKSHDTCHICHVYGLPGEKDFSTPTRLIVRDVQLSNNSVEDMRNMRTALPFTEVKTEVTIDRVTSAANPRQMERVPAGAIFGPAQLVYSLYDLQYRVEDEVKKKDEQGKEKTVKVPREVIESVQDDLNRFETVITGLQLLEDDYLGGLGSRGSGQVVLQDLKVTLKSTASTDAYRNPESLGTYKNLADFATAWGTLSQDISKKVKPNGLIAHNSIKGGV